VVEFAGGVAITRIPGVREGSSQFTAGGYCREQNLSRRYSVNLLRLDIVEIDT
jgi:hypothetical protein